MKKMILALLIAGCLASVSYADRDATFRESMRAAQVTTNSVLASGKIFVGGTNNVAAEVTPSGDVTITTAGVTAIGAGVIVNAHIKSDAAIAATKLSTDAQTSLGKADTALQPNALAVTNVIVGVGDVTNTIVVVGGQVVTWTVSD